MFQQDGTVRAKIYWKCAARGAHDVFTVKDNQPNLQADLRLFFEEGRNQPDFREPPTLGHGRIEKRAIWTTPVLNDYLDFPGGGYRAALKP
ncbi:hypothetical protein SAMN05421783_104243 [Thiocapsa roseopersicina]|uniref:Uncharacterized protein n=1 Tax=Thiocapsa roseopersicina TaxID=1058 RepID=A0A1H2TZ89_THIRO|nr:hypothetical protein SAMN05421783_104243 [Thiocapsa roseopersicina]